MGNKIKTYFEGKKIIVPEEINLKNQNNNNDEALSSLRAAFQEAGNLMRYYLDDRFKIFTLATAVNAAGLAIFTQRWGGSFEIIFPPLIAILTSLCWKFDRSSRYYYEKYLIQALKIQKKLNVTVYLKDNRPFYKRSTPWVNFFYLTLDLIWGIIFLLMLKKS